MPEDKIIRHSYEGEVVTLHIRDEPLIELSHQTNPAVITDQLEKAQVQNYSVIPNFKSNDVFFEINSDSEPIDSLKSNESILRLTNVFYDPITDKYHKGSHSILIQIKQKIALDKMAELTFSKKCQIEHYHDFYQIGYDDSYNTLDAFQKINKQVQSKDENYRWIETVEMNIANFDHSIDPYTFDDRRTNDSTENAVLPEAYNCVEANQAIKEGIGKSEIIIALLDTGVYAEHVDLEQVVSKKSFDFILNEYGSNIQDDDRHGTCCAGLLAAKGDTDKKSFTGIASGCTLLNYRIRFNQTKKDNYHIVKAFLKASFKENAKVISCSWNIGTLSFAIRDAIKKVVKNGTTVVFSAGNEGCEHLFPANMEEVITVAGTTNAGNPKYGGAPCPASVNKWMSNFGPNCDIAAPGEDMPTTDIPNYDSDGSSRYGMFWGTSAAAPLVAACAALMYSINPEICPQTIKTVLKKNTTPFKIKFDQNFGTGVLNVKNSLTDELIRQNNN